MTAGATAQEVAQDEEENVAILAAREDADGHLPMPQQTRKQLICLLVVQLKLLRNYRTDSCGEARFHSKAVDCRRRRVHPGHQFDRIVILYVENGRRHRRMSLQ